MFKRTFLGLKTVWK